MEILSHYYFNDANGAPAAIGANSLT